MSCSCTVDDPVDLSDPEDSASDVDMNDMSDLGSDPGSDLGSDFDEMEPGPELEYGFDEVFVPGPPEEYKCPICLLTCKQAMQTACGHRFCQQCIMKVITEGRPNCPCDNTELDESQVFPDNVARKEIFRLNVRCQNHAQGCEWIGGLGVSKDHLEEECVFTSIECPGTCGEHYLRMNQEEHMASSCEKRIVNCEYCDAKVVFKMLKEQHFEQCPRISIPCPNGCGHIPREEVAEHLKKSCTKSILSCNFKEFGCQFEGARETMNTHMDSKRDEHFEMMAETIKNLKTTCDRLDYELKQNQWKSEQKTLASRITELEHSLDSLKENDVVYFRQQLVSVTQKTEENETSLDEVRSKMWKGCIIWRIANFKELFQQAQDGTTPAINSLAFYSDIPGYKIYIRVNLNGVDAGEGTWVSMFVHVMQGEYDNVIEWPFAGTIVLTVMDQNGNGTDKHMVERLVGKPSIQAFQRPTASRNNKGYGYAKMIPHNHLKSRGYVKDDCMLIKVEVEKQA